MPVIALNVLNAVFEGTFKDYVRVYACFNKAVSLSYPITNCIDDVVVIGDETISTDVNSITNCTTSNLVVDSSGFSEAPFSINYSSSDPVSPVAMIKDLMRFRVLLVRIVLRGSLIFVDSFVVKLLERSVFSVFSSLDLFVVMDKISKRMVQT